MQFDSGSVTSGSTNIGNVQVSPTPINEFADGEADGDGQLTFSTTYFWRVEVYDSGNEPSGYVEGTSFTTPLHSYPDVDFSWVPSKPLEGETTEFKDETNFDDGSGSQRWSWTFPAEAIPSASSDQEPEVVFGESGNKTATLLVTDETLEADVNSGTGQCSKTDTVTVLFPLPEFKEIPPVSFWDRISNLFSYSEFRLQVTQFEIDKYL